MSRVVGKKLTVLGQGSSKDWGWKEGEEGAFPDTSVLTNFPHPLLKWVDPGILVQWARRSRMKCGCRSYLLSRTQYRCNDVMMSEAG